MPGTFPEKYEKALLRSMDQCAVKKVMEDPPDFEVRVVVPEAAATG